jgi:hypothetical protein
MEYSEDHYWDALTPESYKHLRSLGKTKADIARYFKVSRQAVNNMCKRYGIDDRTARQKALDSFVFSGIPEWNDHVSRMLRAHVSYMAAGTLPRGEMRLLRGFYKHLSDGKLIVEYDPTDGGWIYRKREKKDGDMLFRVNRHVPRILTEEDLILYSFPPEDML